jgi:hypothetical protein
MYRTILVPLGAGDLHVPKRKKHEIKMKKRIGFQKWDASFSLEYFLKILPEKGFYPCKQIETYAD